MDLWLLHGIIMPMAVFVILVATNALLNSSEGGSEAPSNKVEDKGKKNGAWVDTLIEERRQDQKNIRMFRRACQALVPTISAVFICIFFGVGYSNSSTPN